MAYMFNQNKQLSAKKKDFTMSSVFLKKKKGNRNKLQATAITATEHPTI
jgi:hypothetical protein